MRGVHHRRIAVIPEEFAALAHRDVERGGIAVCSAPFVEVIAVERLVAAVLDEVVDRERAERTVIVVGHYENVVDDGISHCETAQEEVAGGVVLGERLTVQYLAVSEEFQFKSAVVALLQLRDVLIGTAEHHLRDERHKLLDKRQSCEHIVISCSEADELLDFKVSWDFFRIPADGYASSISSAASSHVYGTYSFRRAFFAAYLSSELSSSFTQRMRSSLLCGSK